MSIKARVKHLEAKRGPGYRIIVPELKYILDGGAGESPCVIAREPGEDFRRFLSRVDPACSRIIASADGAECTTVREPDETFRSFQDRACHAAVEAAKTGVEPGAMFLPWDVYLL